jgi:hypothetical protein
VKSGKYDALTDWLSQRGGTVEVPLDELDEVVPGGLPRSARTYPEWWSNTASNPQGRAWLAAGRRVEMVDLRSGRVRFSSPGRAARVRRATTSAPQGTSASEDREAAQNATAGASHTWFWEGNVQAALVRSLVKDGWEIRRVADTSTGEHGVDIEARREGRRLLVEVKGYPTSVYVRGEKRGQLKSTNPAVQARAYFSHALLAGLLMRASEADARVALAFPEFETYRSLASRVGGPLREAGVEVWLVDERGSVRRT